MRNPREIRLRLTINSKVGLGTRGESSILLFLFGERERLRKGYINSFPVDKIGNNFPNVSTRPLTQYRSSEAQLKKYETEMNRISPNQRGIFASLIDYRSHIFVD